MTLGDLAEIEMKPSIVYVFDRNEKTLMKNIVKNLKKNSYAGAEVIEIECNGIAYYVTIKV